MLYLRGHVHLSCLKSAISVLHQFRSLPPVDRAAPVGTVTLIHVTYIESHHGPGHEFSLGFKRFYILSVLSISRLETTQNLI